MILYIMLVALGFLIAMLLALLLAPAFWRRAERLTARRLEQSMPMSIAEAEAERDQIRASYAIIIRRLEAALSQEKMRSARQLVKISRLQMEIADVNDRTRQLRGQLDAEHNAASVLRRTIATRVPELNRAANDAKQLIHVRESEINTIVNRLRHREEALAIAQRTTEMQQAEIARLRQAMEMSGSQNAGRFKLRPTEWTIHDYRAEYDRLNVELSKLRERLAVAYDREANQVKELRTELQQLADHIVTAASALPQNETQRAIPHDSAADQSRQLASPTEQLDDRMRSIDAILSDTAGNTRASGWSDGSLPTRRSGRSGSALARAADAPKRLALGAIQKVAGLAGATGKAMSVVSGNARNQEPAPMPGEVSAARLLGGAAVSHTRSDGARASEASTTITDSAEARLDTPSAVTTAMEPAQPKSGEHGQPDTPDDATPDPAKTDAASDPEASDTHASQPQTTNQTLPPVPSKASHPTHGDSSLYDSYRSAKPISEKSTSEKPTSDKRADPTSTAAPDPSEAGAPAQTEEPAPAEPVGKADHMPAAPQDHAQKSDATDANEAAGDTSGSLLDRLKHVPESETR